MGLGLGLGLALALALGLGRTLALALALTIALSIACLEQVDEDVRGGMQPEYHRPRLRQTDDRPRRDLVIRDRVRPRLRVG